MTSTRLQQRQNLYYNLSSQCALISNEKLASLTHMEGTRSSFGENNTLDLDGGKVFIKRVPITDLEYANMFSTRNLYDLPTFYNYPYNSAGLGVFRELVAHIRTTNWVLDGSCPNFPLMYHYRIIPFTGEREPIPADRMDRYIEYWDSNANIRRYIDDRVAAKYELLLFLEHFPQSVQEWLVEDQSRITTVLSDMHDTLGFLLSKGILHLDTHFGNIVTDGEHAYLTDFGLVLDKAFDLSPAEQQFFSEHNMFDYGNLLWSLGFPLAEKYRNLSEDEKQRLSEQYNIPPPRQIDDLLLPLLNNLDALTSSGALELDPLYTATLRKYLEIVVLMHTHYITMRANNKKDDYFDNERLGQLLHETGYL